MINKIAKNIGCALLAFLVALVFIAMFMLAYLQESYRLCPPSEAERAQNPVLIEFLIGKRK